MRRSRGFTMLELLLASVLMMVLMIGVLGVIARLGGTSRADGAQRQGSREADSFADAQLIDGLVRLLEKDLIHASSIEMIGESEISLVGYAAIDMTRHSLIHRPVAVTYHLEEIDGQTWMIRRQAFFDELTNQGVRIDLVGAGIRKFKLLRDGVVPDDRISRLPGAAEEVIYLVDGPFDGSGNELAAGDDAQPEGATLAKDDEGAFSESGGDDGPNLEELLELGQHQRASRARNQASWNNRYRWVRVDNANGSRDWRLMELETYELLDETSGAGEAPEDTASSYEKQTETNDVGSDTESTGEQTAGGGNSAGAVVGGSRLATVTSNPGLALWHLQVWTDGQPEPTRECVLTVVGP